jgi:hypothetical protein
MGTTDDLASWFATLSDSDKDAWLEVSRGGHLLANLTGDVPLERWHPHDGWWIRLEESGTIGGAVHEVLTLSDDFRAFLREQYDLRHDDAGPGS